MLKKEAFKVPGKGGPFHVPLTGSLWRQTLRLEYTEEFRLAQHLSIRTLDITCHDTVLLTARNDLHIPHKARNSLTTTASAVPLGFNSTDSQNKLHMQDCHGYPNVTGRNLKSRSCFNINIVCVIRSLRHTLPVQEAVRSKASVFGRSPAEIVGSNPAGEEAIACAELQSQRDKIYRH
jgi:hypothetical protein